MKWMINPLKNLREKDSYALSSHHNERHHYSEHHKVVAFIDGSNAQLLFRSFALKSRWFIAVFESRLNLWWDKP